MENATLRAGDEGPLSQVAGPIDFENTKPEDVAVRLELGNAYIVLNQPDAAISQLSEVIELSPNHMIAHNNLAELLKKGSGPGAAACEESA